MASLKWRLAHNSALEMAPPFGRRTTTRLAQTAWHSPDILDCLLTLPPLSLPVRPSARADLGTPGCGRGGPVPDPHQQTQITLLAIIGYYCVPIIANNSQWCVSIIAINLHYSQLFVII